MLYPTAAETVVTGAISDLNDIFFVNDTLGYIVGGEKYESSELLTTTDGGLTWKRFYKNGYPGHGVNKITSNGYKMIAVGYGGLVCTPVVNTEDWQLLYTKDEEWLQSIAFTEPNKGFIVSGEGYGNGSIIRIDSSFNTVKQAALPYQLNDIAFADNKIGYACGYGVVLKTIDGGDNWGLQNIQGDFFRSICVMDSLNIWASGANGSIIHTSDGGKKWEKQRNGDNPLIPKYRLRGIVFKDLMTGYAAGEKGIILKTADGGVHWALFKQLTDKDLKCIALQPDGTIWVAGADGIVLHITE